uniref:Receptor expression-enhancing protein n=1 Tax=Sus scrofa TaxID=9823 RepID=A0A8D1V6F3_PIG
GLVQRILLDRVPATILFFTQALTIPFLSLPPPPLSSTPGRRPRDTKSRKWEVRVQGSRPRGLRVRLGVPPAQPPEPGRPDRASANAPRPPPISGAQGRGPLARRRLLRQAGTGGGSTAAQLRPPRADTGPGSRGRQRGPGEREEPASARPTVDGLVRHARRPPTLPGGVQAPGKMVSWMISRAVVLVFGMLYPAYYSYKAVKTKNVKEYVRWMMYWIVFALYTVIETVADQTVAWFPLYYELKIAFVIWLLSPYTKGASLIYRKFLHPLLSAKEREIDDYIVQAKERGYETMVNFGRQGLNLAATAAVTAAVKDFWLTSAPILQPI